MDYYVAVLSIMGVHILLGLSVYLVAITGQLSFGQQGFYAIGAYVAGVCTALWGTHLVPALLLGMTAAGLMGFLVGRSEEHTSELQSLAYLVCRLLLEKKKNSTTDQTP